MFGVFILQISVILVGCVSNIITSPMPDSKEIVTSVEASGIPPLLSFKDGRVGVNFLGFKASAGLGGRGGLHASAETPFGQKAAAGLGGYMDRDGRASGGLYAGATAGGGIGAAAGLGGTTGVDGSEGGTYAGASNGYVSKTIVKEGAVPAAIAGSSVELSDSEHIQKIPPSHSAPPVESVVKEAPLKRATSFNANIHVEKEIHALPQPPPPPSAPVAPVQTELSKKTYIERTVIPNYVEKTIHVPSYVEKTIRVPTLVEKKIKVSAPPTVIEKEVEIPHDVQPVSLTKTKVIQREQIPNGAFVTKTKTKFRRRPWIYLNKQLQINSGEVPNYDVATSGGGVAAIGNNYEPNHTKNGDLNRSYSATFTKSYNGGDLVRNIFNIPIATLGAVSNLVSGIVGDTAGSVSVSKSASFAATAGK